MRRRIVSIALVVLFAAQALSLAAMEAWHCSCRIKSLCCREKACPMDLGRKAPKDQPAVAQCGGSSDRFVPLFLQWRAVVPDSPSTIEELRIVEYAERAPAQAIAGEPAVPEHPPRASALVMA